MCLEMLGNLTLGQAWIWSWESGLEEGWAGREEPQDSELEDVDKGPSEQWLTGLVVTKKWQSPFSLSSQALKC